ncbi:uncharacterized protein LOC133802419 [Humulus lupulus]|uniref:uncharacterized protein LOC133802419 n=1 Tax=Humulus lupulus TaxID=3486 RepID=UPI002B409EF4|nr:uncharacterized protein LOC133802419 [Humulus lupulus]
MGRMLLVNRHEQRYPNPPRNSPGYVSYLLLCLFAVHMQDPWGGEIPIEDDLLAQLLEGEENPSTLILDIPFSRLSPNTSPVPTQRMARTKTKAQKRKIPNSSCQPTADAPSTSGRGENIPDTNVQRHARPRHAAQPNVEWHVVPQSRVTIRMIANYLNKYKLTGVTLVRPSLDQRANLPGRAYSAWSRFHIEAGDTLPLHSFFQGLANYFGVAPFQITPNGYRMLAALYILYKLKKWPEPTPHEVNFLFDVKFNPNQEGTGFFHFFHQETGRTFLADTTHISNVGRYHQEYFLTPDLAVDNLAFTRGGKNSYVTSFFA